MDAKQVRFQTERLPAANRVSLYGERLTMFDEGGFLNLSQIARVRASRKDDCFIPVNQATVDLINSIVAARVPESAILRASDED